MIHVLIERQIADDMTSTYEELARGALHRSYIAPGFISGETFTDAHDSKVKYVFCKWRSEQDWLRWLESTERMEIMSSIAQVLQQPEKISVLEN